MITITAEQVAENYRVVLRNEAARLAKEGTEDPRPEHRQRAKKASTGLFSIASMSDDEVIRFAELIRYSEKGLI